MSRIQTFTGAEEGRQRESLAAEVVCLNLQFILKEPFLTALMHSFLTRINGKCIFNANIMTLDEDELLFKLALK